MKFRFTVNIDIDMNAYEDLDSLIEEYHEMSKIVKDSSLVIRLITDRDSDVEITSIEEV
jgi:hypothetical protein